MYTPAEKTKKNREESILTSALCYVEENETSPTLMDLKKAAAKYATNHFSNNEEIITNSIKKQKDGYMIVFPKGTPNHVKKLYKQKQAEVYLLLKNHYQL